MGRRRSFEEGTVVLAAWAEFTTRGYEATSIDDLVAATGLARGSLYQAFGSKRGIFLAALRRLVAEGPPEVRGAAQSAPSPAEAGLDLVLVAALELAPRDDEVRALVQQACQLVAVNGAADVLGRRLLARAGVEQNSAGGRQTPVVTGDTEEQE